MAIKLKTRTKFPALVVVESPLTLVKNGLIYIFGIDVDTLLASIIPALTPVFLTPRLQRVVTAAGAVTVEVTDDDVIVQKTVGAATTVNLPLASSRTRPVMVIDGKGDAATNNITIVPQSGETIYATADYHAIIDGNGGSVVLTPRTDGTGWY